MILLFVVILIVLFYEVLRSNADRKISTKDFISFIVLNFLWVGLGYIYISNPYRDSFIKIVYKILGLRL